MHLIINLERMIYMEESSLDIVEMKSFITKRFLSKKSLKKYLQKNVNEVISEVIDADEEFLNAVERAFSDKEEMNFIKDKTGYSIELIEKILWERHCFEMKEGIWEYNVDVCLKCDSSHLLLREAPDVEYGEKVVCQKCGFEMMLGVEGLEPYN